MTNLRLLSLALCGALAASQPAYSGAISASVRLEARTPAEALALRAVLAHRAVRTGTSENDATPKGRDLGRRAASLLLGGQNLALVEQHGSGHAASLAQTGTGNAYGIIQIGRGATASVSQSGQGGSGLLLQWSR